MLVTVSIVVAALLAACGVVGGPSGILDGKVTLGPLSPVEQVGGPPMPGPMQRPSTSRRLGAMWSPL
jgi:hypothetical protein